MPSETNSSAQLDKNVVVFGGDATYPPFEWQQNGSPTGFNVDLQREIAQVGGVAARHVLASWPDTIQGLESGEIDVVAMFRSAGREQSFRFSSPFYYVHHAIYGRHDAPRIGSVTDLDGNRIAVEARSFANDRLVELGLSAQLVLSQGTLEALQFLRNGEADYAILAEPSAASLIRTHELQLRPIGAPFWPVEYAFAVRKDRIRMAEWLDEHLATVIESGSFREIKAKWMDNPGALPPTSVWVKYLPIALSCLVVLGGLWVWKLRGRLNRYTSLLTSAESRFRWASDHYTETGMPKRHHFSAEVTKHLAQAGPGERWQVVVTTLAESNRTIQTLGHDVALDAIRSVAERLQRAGFPACGQLGRDAFVIFGRKEQIDKEFRSEYFQGDTIAMRSPYPRMYAGVATWPKHGETVPELLKNAESALARAVERRMRWVDFRPFMEPNSEDLELITQFRAKGGAAIYPVFQPQVDIGTGRIVGAEALARCKLPGMGHVSPARFIPILEDNGLTRFVTRRMISMAVRVAAKLRKAGYPCPISVNVTGDDLLGWTLAAHISRCLRHYDGNVADLKLELTETGVVDRPELLRWKMQRLVKNGIELSIDDFGTGYSSLAYLSNFPVRELKIDQQFVRNMIQSKRDMSIVSSTITMGRELGLTLVAEGVETEEELRTLRRLGCDRAQGFSLSRPLKEKQFVEFVMRHVTSRIEEGASSNVADLRQHRRNKA